MDPVEIIQSVQIERVCDDYILCDADSKFAFSMFYARFFLHFYLQHDLRIRNNNNNFWGANFNFFFFQSGIK